MIDVPIAVRDALKDGGYKKNYRFIVGDAVKTYVYEDVATLEPETPYTVTRAGEMRFYNAFNNVHDFEIQFDNGETVTILPVERMIHLPQGGYYYPYNITAEMIGGVITIFDAYDSLVLQDKTSEEQEVFIQTDVIENDRLVKESVKIDERMCSDDTLKFGLCEGTSIEFQAFNINNITGKRIRAYVDVDYPIVTYDYDEETDKTTRYETIESYPIPMGWFDVQESSRQASTGIRKISAYNKLKAEYLDANAADLIKAEFGEESLVRVLDIIRLLLKDYGIRTEEGEYWDVSDSHGVISNAKKSFRPFKYSTLWGDQGAFSPVTRPDGPSTSSSMYMNGYANKAIYRLPQDNTGVFRVEIDECVESLDNAIVTFLQNQFTLIRSSTTPEEIWNRLHNMSGQGDVFGGSIDDYFFYVCVYYQYDPYTRTHPVEFYGNHLRNATGSFEDLRRRTLTNVSTISIVTPWAVDMGYKLSSYGHPQNDIRVYLTGQNRTYEYYGTGYTDVRTNTYTTPKMPNGTDIPDNICDFFKVKTITSGVSPIELRQISTADISTITLRDIQTAVFEMNCQFGKLDRVNNFFTGVELNNRRLYPADSLYPDDELYPMSISEGGFKAMYSKLWADEGNVRTWRNLNISYKGLRKNEESHEVEEVDKVYTAEINAEGTDDYNITNNWLFKNLLWADDESEDFPEAATLEKIETYAAAMVAKMESVSYFPFEMWCAGLPYVETGDEVEIHVGEHAYTSYVLRRTIKGIQNLQDEMINGTLDIF